jgi:anti-anti-sigma regulatory factor
MGREAERAMSNLGAAQKKLILVIDDNAAIHSDFERIFAADRGPPSRSSAALDAMEADLFGDAEPRVEPRADDAHYALTTAYQGEDGVELVQKARERGAPFAVAFVDVRMPPGIDGVEALHRMFGVDPDIQGVLCTAYTDVSWRKITERLWQVDRYLILKKPFEPEEVRQMAAALSAKWAHERARAAAHAALAALSTPLVPITRHVVVMPLVGEIDARRGERMRAALLSGIAARRTRTVIVDVTGVPSLDERVAEELSRTVSAIRLLGADMVMTGLGGEAARAIVQRDIALIGIRMFLSLEDGVAYALRRRGRR